VNPAALIRALRPHQWVKNVLVFVPPVLAHRFDDPEAWTTGAVAFAAMCLIASGGYLINDLRDRAHDRLHPAKRRRPLAEGTVTAGVAGVIATVLLAAGLGGGAATLPRDAVIGLGVYAVGTLSYSAAWKRVPVLDVLVLAGLYVVRLVIGGTATATPLSPWLLALAMFLFLSLATVKRHGELTALTARGAEDGDAPGRGYRVADRDLLRTLGLSTGVLSVLVLALYVQSEAVRVLYDRPWLVLLACPLLLYWIVRIWLLSVHGELDDDPLVFTLRDPVGWVVGIAVVAVIWAAT
jgi:4-hydroxybenzoate polyprenyltransferase